MFCAKCGNEVSDGADFCSKCGAPVKDDCSNTAPVNTMANEAVYTQGIPMYTNKKIKKKILPIVIALIALAAAVLAILFVLKKNTHLGAQGALDRYFEAVNDFNIKDMYECCYPDKSKYASFANAPLYSFYQDYSRSYIAKADVYKLNPCFTAHYLQYYGYSCNDYNNIDEAYKTLQTYQKDAEKIIKRWDEVSKSDIKKILPDFKASYKLNKMVDGDDCTINILGEQVNDIKSYINSKVGVEPSEIKVANITVEWKYGDKLYGYDKDWWNQEDFVSVLSSLNSGNFSSYDSAIEFSRKGATVDVILYKYKGKWFVYPPYVLKPLIYNVEY